MRRIITLCGSTKFKEAFEDIEKRLTLEGVIVLSVGFFEKIDGTELSNDQFKLLEELHKEKIRMSEAIFVINKNGYIGESTLKEIEYAQKLGKRVCKINCAFSH